MKVPGREACPILITPGQQPGVMAPLLNISPERVELRREAKKRRVDERSEVDPENSGRREIQQGARGREQGEEKA